MSRPRLVKLVRDDVARFLADVPGGCEVHYAPIEDREKAILELRKKLVEEVAEYLLEPCIGELADIQEAVDALLHHDLQESQSTLIQVQHEKREERGGFYGLVGMWCRTTADSRHER